MSEARKFVARSPRYTLQPTDNRYIRFAREDEFGNTHTTIFIDISTTGLAFVIDRDQAPHLSDLIKVEIPLEDGQSVAWWARVVRVEEYTIKKWYMKRENFAGQNPVLVAVQFEKLPVGHTVIIRKALDHKFKEVFKAHRRQKVLRSLSYLHTYGWRILVYVALTLATVWFLWYFAQPTPNYNPNAGSPWGQRFPSLDFYSHHSKGSKDF